jgi:hypothetical protein
MSNVRVIKLDNINGQENIQVSSYEDAFEGYSNARGGRKKARQDKRLQKFADRTEFKKSKSEVRRQRREDPALMADRERRRKNAERGLLGVFTGGLSEIGYKASKSRKARKQREREEEEAMPQEVREEATMGETSPKPQPPQYNEDYSQQEDSGYVDNSQQEQGYDEPRPQGYDDRDVPRDNSADNYRDEQLEDAGYDAEQNNAEDISNDESGFNEEYGSLTGIDETNVTLEVQKVPKPVLEAVKGIQDHKNRIAILMLQKEKGKTELPQVFCKFDGEGDDIDAMINTSNERIIDLEGKVESYQNANGVQAKRNVAVARQYCQRRKTKPTLVNPKLGAIIESQRIVVPARRDGDNRRFSSEQARANFLAKQNQKSSFDAIDSDGRVHPNYEIDIDGTQGRKFDIYSNADGTSGNMDIIKPIVIGAIVSIGAIYLVNYFKLIK